MPQNPFSEQQLPKVDVRHVALVSELEPQLPSLLVGFFARGSRTGEDELGPVSQGGFKQEVRVAYSPKLKGNEAEARESIHRKYTRESSMSRVWLRQRQTTQKEFPLGRPSRAQCLYVGSLLETTLAKAPRLI